jgi:hypothetical protein
MTRKYDERVTINSDYISGEIIFETLLDSRLVDCTKSVIHVLRIKKWLTENEFKFEFKVEDLLIPENNTNPDDRYSLVSFKDNFNLLSPNKAIPFNHALFLLMGLDVSALVLPPFNQLKLTDYHQPELDSSKHFEHVFYVSDEFNELVYSRFVREDGKILSDDLIKLGVKGKFFEFKKLEKKTNKKTNQKNVRQTNVLDALIHFLTLKLESNKIYTLSEIMTNKSFAKSLNNKGLTLTDDEDANYQPSSNKNEILPSKLKDDLYEVIKFDCWDEKYQNLRKLVKYNPQKKKK